MKAILPVAGSGTRMYPLGVTTPKCLLTVLNKPILLWTIETLVTNGIDEIIVVISAGKFGKLIRDYVESLTIPDVKLHIAVQEQQLGTAHVLQSAKRFFTKGEQFLMLYGDDLYGPKNIQSVLKAKTLVVLGQEVKDPEKWGIFQTDSDGHLGAVIEKPTEFVGSLANIGCMKLSTKIFDLFETLSISSRGEYELTDTLSLLARQEPIKVLPTTDYWIPIGYPWHLLDATAYFLPKMEPSIQGKVEAGATIAGNVVLPKTSTVHAGTVIEGNVLIGENCSIGPHTYIKGNVVIGNGSTIGFSGEVKNSIIGENSLIARLSYVSDSIIGNGVNFSAGCIVANRRHDRENVRTPVKGQMVDTLRVKFGTVIGDQVSLGVGTVIYPGRKIWPSVTTRPGEIVQKDLITT